MQRSRHDSTRLDYVSECRLTVLRRGSARPGPRPHCPHEASLPPTLGYDLVFIFLTFKRTPPQLFCKTLNLTPLHSCGVWKTHLHVPNMKRMGYVLAGGHSRGPSTRITNGGELRSLVRGFHPGMAGSQPLPPLPALMCLLIMAHGTAAFTHACSAPALGCRTSRRCMVGGRDGEIMRCFVLLNSTAAQSIVEVLCAMNPPLGMKALSASMKFQPPNHCGAPPVIPGATVRG